ncbi:MAG TPA: histidine biosynthesis protein [Firmicutes bacterium]|nr:histidine biosynthesis protein [Candidatus Fermentithermobacillaceae bacterium]
MIKGDMRRKREVALAKVLSAIKMHGGTTLLSTGITGDDARLAKAAVEAGARMLEPNHPAVALARGYKGVTNMHAAEAIRHEISIEQMAEVTRGVRSVVGPDIFITVGIPGGFTEVLPRPLSEDDVRMIAEAGADGLHVHKSDLDDLRDIVELAHANGLLVDAYVAHPDDLHPFGIPASTPEEVADTAKKMESIGVDMIGLMTGMSYEGVEAGQIPAVIRERLQALVGAVTRPTLAEGGINLTNFQAFRGTGVNILVVGTAFDDIARQAVRDTVKRFLGGK